MIRILAFLGGLGGAVSLSQFPEFSQQYLQRLGGAVDGLRPTVIQFDKDALEEGQTREEALTSFEQAGGIVAKQGQAKRSEIERFEGLNEDYSNLREAQPLQRLAQVYRFSDADLVRSTWEDFRPAVPATLDGVICAAIGYAIVWLTILLSLSGLLRLFRRKGSAEEKTAG